MYWRHPNAFRWYILCQWTDFLSDAQWWHEVFFFSIFKPLFKLGQNFKLRLSMIWKAIKRVEGNLIKIQPIVASTTHTDRLHNYLISPGATHWLSLWPGHHSTSLHRSIAAPTTQSPVACRDQSDWRHKPWCRPSRSCTTAGCWSLSVSVLLVEVVSSLNAASSHVPPHRSWPRCYRIIIL